ncbi:MAG: hypothetical protein NTX85_01890 [Candidatus Nomurabacteria bacterium]|nr:hypothetical protein [Candidatus Nomurabacteria bacterium]
MNNKTKNLIAFAFTAFVFVFATHASAAVTSDDYGTPRYNYNNQPYAQPYMQTYGNQYQQYPQQSYNQTYQQPYNQNYGQQYNQNYGAQTGYAAPVNNPPVNNPVVASNTFTNTNTTKATTVRRVVASNTQARPVAVSQNQVAGTNVGVISASDMNQASVNNLPALSLRGSNSFMPDTVFEWLLTIIFILVIIIIIRVMSRKHGPTDHH